MLFYFILSKSLEKYNEEQQYGLLVLFIHHLYWESRQSLVSFPYIFTLKRLAEDNN